MEPKLTSSPGFEEFLLKHVRRQQIVYTVVAWVFRLLVIASVLIFIAELLYRFPFLKSLLVLVLGGGFAISSTTFMSMAKEYKEAREEMAYGLSHPECNVPEDYEDNTKQVRIGICNVLKSVRSLIFAYGFVALMLWVMTPFMFWASGIGYDFAFEPVLFAVSFVMPAMALPLTILTISYCIGYRETMHFMPDIVATCASEKSEKN